MSEKRCDNCRHWRVSEKYTGFPSLHPCDAVVTLWDATTWDKDADEETCLTEKDPTRMAYVQDGSDYVAIFYTKASFFCAMHTPTPEPEHE